jgi:hypothetical protein
MRRAGPKPGGRKDKMDKQVKAEKMLNAALRVANKTYEKECKSASTKRGFARLKAFAIYRKAIAE